MRKPSNFESDPGDEQKPHKELSVSYDRVLHYIEAGMGNERSGGTSDHDDMIERVQKLKVGEDTQLWDFTGQCLKVKKVTENEYDIELIPKPKE